MSLFEAIPEPGAGKSSEPEMPAEFGLATATFVIVASMIGVGVLTTSGFTVASVGSNQWMLGLWVVGGIVALCGALTIAELSAALPKSGGDYVYLHAAYGPLAAFLSGWVSFLIGFAAPIAASAIAASRYLLDPFLSPEDPAAWWAYRLLATSSILVLAAVHASGRGQTVRVQGALTILKLALLAAFVVAGLAVGWPGGENLSDRTPLTSSTVQAMLFSLVYIGYAYTGWNAASYVAGEVRDTQRTLPRAIVLGTVSVMVLYLGMNVVYALALPASEIGQLVSDRGFSAVEPIAELAAVRLFGTMVAAPLSVAIGLLLLSMLGAMLLTGPRVVFAMARSRQLPAFAGRLSPKTGTPVVATWLQSLWAVALMWLADANLEILVVYAGVGLSMFSMLTISAVYVLRWRQPDLPRPFRVPGYPVTPAIFLGVTALLIVAVFQQRPDESRMALLSILAGVPIFFADAWLRRRWRRPVSGA